MTRARLSILLVVTGLVVAACGAAEVLAPRLAVRDAARATAEQERSRFTLSLVGDDAAVTALFDEGEPAGADDAKALELLCDSRLTVTTDKAGAFGLDLQVGDVEHAFELRVIDGTLFFRGDAPDLARLFGAEPGELDAMVAGAREAGFGFVADAVAGRWLSADLSRFTEMAESAPVADTERRAFLDAITKAWGEDVKVDRLDDDHYRLTVAIRQVYEHLVPLLGSLPGFPGAEMIPPAGEVPDKSVSAEVWVSDGKISRAELDLAQFSETSAGRVALRVDISSPDSALSTPDDAVDIDLFKLIEPFIAGFAGALSGGMTTS